MKDKNNTSKHIGFKLGGFKINNPQTSNPIKLYNKKSLPRIHDVENTVLWMNRLFVSNMN